MFSPNFLYLPLTSSPVLSSSCSASTRRCLFWKCVWWRAVLLKFVLLRVLSKSTYNFWTSRLFISGGHDRACGYCFSFPTPISTRLYLAPVVMWVRFYYNICFIVVWKVKQKDSKVKSCAKRVQYRYALFRKLCRLYLMLANMNGRGKDTIYSSNIQSTSYMQVFEIKMWDIWKFEILQLKA